MKNKTVKLILTSLIFLVTTSVNGAVLNLQINKTVPVISVDTTNGNKYLLKFDLSSIPAGSTIDLAELYLKIQADTGQNRYQQLAVFPVSSDWSETSVILTEDQVSYIDTNLTTESIDITSDKVIDLNLTRIVTDWFEGNVTNKGLLITPLENSFRVKNLVPISGIVAEFKIFYTAPEVKK